ncbi:hypothetical protein GOP47_0007809 [Adiantum capillus-veneris]|nr:hypothetical protein GOP47_0007809 [Adiantum capillus-veneris]
MPRLTPDNSPVLHMGISRQDNDRRDRDVSNQESRGEHIRNQETRGHGAYSQSCREGRNRSRWRTAFQPIMHDEEGSRPTSHTTATASRGGALNVHVNLLTESQVENDAKWRECNLPFMQTGRACEPLMSQVKNVADCDVIQHRKTTCSTPVGDKSLSSSSHGHFRLVEQDGTPCYSFSVHDSKEMFFARACRPESQFYGDNSNNGFHYAFHCRREDKAKGGWNCRLRKEKLPSTLVANMKISAVGDRIDRNRRIEEAHFVLYAESTQDSAAERKAREEDLVMRSSKAVLCGHKSMEKFMIQKGRVWIELLAVAITMSIKLEKHKDARESSHESACIQRAACVDRSSQKGWGVEFLSKSSKDGIGLKAPIQQEKVRQLGNESLEVVSRTHLEKLQDRRDVNESQSDEGLKCHYSVDTKCKELKKAVDVVVLLPAGCHGLRSDEDSNSAGPTPLLECWRLNGTCDCGGWDMGCGMSVLRAETLRLHKRSTIALTNRDRINWILPGRPFVIFSQGYLRRKLLMIDIIEAGLFSLSFQAQFSPLQAFATAVAIFHQQMTLK